MASIFHISDDFSVVNWRRRFWNFALFSVSWSRWPITQYFKFLWAVYFNMYTFDERTMHTATCLQWSGLLKCAASRIKDFTFSSNTCNRRHEEKPRIKVSFVFTSLITCNLCLLLISVEQLFICVFFSGPARILCLTVASGWNKERCMPESELIITLAAKFSVWTCLAIYYKCSVIFWAALREFLFFCPLISHIT